jgi:hypothetical protein
MLTDQQRARRALNRSKSQDVLTICEAAHLRSVPVGLLRSDAQ